MDDLAIVNRVIQEHHQVAGHLEQTGHSLNDFEALFNAQKVYSEWTQSSVEELSGKVSSLQKTIASLAERLEKHFGYEEQYLPSLLGSVLYNWLILEHKEISKNLKETEVAISQFNLEDKNREALLQRKTVLNQDISQLSQLIQEHASKEETVLNMMKKALESKR